MERLHVFADESGNFDFSVKKGASRYFILTTVTVSDGHTLAADLRRLRYELAWAGNDVEAFHAMEDRLEVKRLVFERILRHELRIDATILEKRKAKPLLRSEDSTFYRYAWFYHLKHLLPRIGADSVETLVVAASVGTRSRRASFRDALRVVADQLGSPRQALRTAHWQAASDPCLQVADYCSWAIQRKWEQGDGRAFSLVEPLVASEFDLFARGDTCYY
jgi:Protein of unknown function (DUF3800)